MKTALTRLLSVQLCLVLLLTLFSGTAYADSEIWIAAPTGWTSPEQVDYHTVSVNGNTYVLNWGVRGERAVFLTSYALAYYGAPDWAADLMAEKTGGTGTQDVLDSSLYAALRSFLIEKQSYETSYGATRDLFKYTDCMISDSAHISSFYSGIKLNGAWDGGSTWNREHTWPNSKGFDNQDNDLMMLRPTSVEENSSRGNLAYGESPGFYHPNIEAGNRFDLRGDVARIMLYCYVRWSNQDYMWGQDGVIESLDVMLGWMEEDPVDTWEMGRNDSMQSITGVRNCFVDYPELAWALFGQEIPADAYLNPHEPDPEPFRFDDVTEPSDYFFAPVYWAMEAGITAGVDDTHFGPKKTCTRAQIVTFLWKACGSPEPTTTASPFTDVKEGKYYYKPVLWALDSDITGGVDATHFGSNRGCTRAQAMTFLWKACDSPEPAITENPFADVPEGKYYCKPVLWAVENGITSGTSATTFGVNKICTRAQIVTFLYKAFHTAP